MASITLEVDCFCPLCKGATDGHGVKHCITAQEGVLAGRIVANGGQPVLFAEDMGIACGLSVAFNEREEVILQPHR